MSQTPFAWGRAHGRNRSSDRPSGCRLRHVSAYVGVVVLALAVSAAAGAATYNVTTTVDENDGLGVGGVSLREAIIAANGNAGLDTINVPAGTYTLTRAGTGEDAAATGDLDITDTVSIVGAGQGLTIVSANGIDRVFHVTAFQTVVGFTGLTITGGASSDGGGILTMADLTLVDCAVSSNTANISGGGIFNGGTLSLLRCTVAGNTADFDANDSGDGGGIYETSGWTLNLTESAITGNNAYNGGGVALRWGAGNFSNSTLSGNEADNNGGGIYADLSYTTLVQCTVTDNTADSDANGSGDGGGIYSDLTDQTEPKDNGFFTSLLGTIVALNSDSSATGTVHNDVSGSFTSAGYNLIGDSTGSTGFTHGASGDQVGSFASPINPLLWALADNGGPTQTHALLTGSPVIDAGFYTDGAGANPHPHSLVTDQRGTGFPRFQDGDGNSTQIVDIGAFEFVNTAPTADAGGPYTINEGQPVTLDGSGSSDPENDPLTYAWDVDNDTAYDDATGVGPTFPWASLVGLGLTDGGYTIGLRVSDSILTDTDTATLIINNLSPTAVDDTGSTDEDTVLNVPATGVLFNDTDPGGDPLTVTGHDAPSTKGAPVTVNADGSYSYDPTGVAAFNALAIGESTTDTFTYTIGDGDGGTDTATVTITIYGVNDPPTAVDDTGSTDEDTVLDVTAPGVLFNDTDPDTSDILTVSGSDAVSAMGATVTVNADGSYTYNPTGVAALNALAVGEFTTDTFSYTVSDGQSGGGTSKAVDTATVTITVNGVNDPPTAVDDAGTTDEDSVLNAAAPGVLFNDTDPDTSDTLTVSGSDTTSAKGAAVAVSADGSFSYDPTGVAAFNALAVGEFTSDTFSYTVSDGQGGVDKATDSATVTIIVTGVNDPPTAVDDVNSTNEDTPLNVAAPGVLTNDTDPDTSDTLTVSGSDATSAQGAAVTVYADGSYTYDPTGSAALQAMTAGDSMVDTFSYTVSDGQGSEEKATDTATVSVTVTGVPEPVITLVPSSVKEGEPVGTFVGILATGPSETRAHGETFEFVPGTGSDNNGSFSIVNGNEVLTGEVFQFDVKNQYTIRVRTPGGEGAEPVEQALLIHILRVPTTPFPPPTNVAASDGTIYYAVLVQWDLMPDVTSYSVYRSKANDFATAHLLWSTNTRFILDTSAHAPSLRGEGCNLEELFGRYYYWVVANYDGGASPPEGPDIGYRGYTQPATVFDLVFGMMPLKTLGPAIWQPAETVPVFPVTPEAPMLGAVGSAYAVAPDMVLEEPSEVWLPVPEGADLEQLALYYYHAGPEAPGWYLAEEVSGWLLPGSYQLTTADTEGLGAGPVYFGFTVQHPAIVQLGLPPESMVESSDAGMIPGEQSYLGGILLALLLVTALAAGHRRRRVE